MGHCKKLFIFVVFIGMTIPLISVFSATTEITYPEIASGIIPPMTTRAFLPIYVKYIFSTLVALSGIIAFGSGAYAGVRIAMSAGDPSAFSDAKDQLFAAGLGIAFTLGAVVILNTVDPQIVTIRPYTEMDLGIYLDVDKDCKNVDDLVNLLSNPAIDSSKFVMAITKSNPDLGAFNAHCLKFVSPATGTLEAKIYSGINYSGLIPGAYNNDASAEATFSLPSIPKSISFVWKIAGVYLIKASNEEKYVPESTGVLGDFNDKATKIRFRSTPLPDQIYFGAVLHENENWSRRCKVYVTDGSIDPPPPPPFDITKWVTIIPPVTPTAHGAPFGVSSVTTFNPTKVGSASDGVTFCEHENDGGNCYGPYRTKKGDVDVKYDPEPAIFPQDTITSIKIQGSYIAVLFAEPSAGGVCEVFTGSHANLRDNPIGMCYCGPFGSFCRDCLSSFIIIPMR